LQSGYWEELAAPDFAGLDVETSIAVLPVGAVEQHGPHLPLGTDALINAGIVAATLPRLSADACVLVLPPLALGASAEHEDVPGTLSIAAERLLPVWIDAGRSVARAGLRKLVILNTHGGQRALVDLAAMRLRVDEELFVVRCNYFAFGAPDGLFDAAEWSQGLHGGEVETSLMLHLHPELVRTEKLQDFAGLTARLAGENRWLGAEKPIGFGWKARDLHPSGVVGNAARADAARGAAYLEHIADGFATLLAEVAAAPLSLLAAPGEAPPPRG
jgi:creatinine amidohydrolase